MSGPIATSKQQADFESNVFINCPFDDEYYLLLRPLIFTVIYCGYNPRIASERSDSVENRVDKICELICDSRYSIHDLSRLQASRPDEFYRMNMPFELGIEYGVRRFGPDHMRAKRCLILEKARYDFMRALSDISGVDIKDHASEPDKVVRAVRNWFVETVGLREMDSPTMIWNRFNDFTWDLYNARRREGFSREDLDMMPIPEYMDAIHTWLS